MNQQTKIHKDWLTYQETQNKLSVRIEANKRFSNFSLEQWLEKYLPFKEGELVLDVGCGNGNLFPAYAQKLGSKGLIVGLDKSQELLSEANAQQYDTPHVLINGNMSQSFPFINNYFNHIVSVFAIYYADDVPFVVEEFKRVLKTHGSIVLIGPTLRNAAELYEYNSKVFGLAKDQRVNVRSTRIETEFYPQLLKSFKDVVIEKVPMKLVFPDQEEFLKYYLATLLFQESIQTTGRKPSIEELVNNITSLEISKEMVMLYAKDKRDNV